MRLRLLLLRLRLALLHPRLAGVLGRGWVRGGVFPARSALAPRCRVDWSFDLRIVRRRRRRSFYVVGENGVKVSGQLMTARVDVDRGIKGSNEEGLFDAAFDPITFIRQNSLVF